MLKIDQNIKEYTLMEIGKLLDQHYNFYLRSKDASKFDHMIESLELEACRFCTHLFTINQNNQSIIIPKEKKDYPNRKIIYNYLLHHNLISSDAANFFLSRKELNKYRN